MTTPNNQNNPIQQNNRLLETMNRYLRQMVQSAQQQFRQQQQGGSGQVPPQGSPGAAGPGPIPTAAPSSGGGAGRMLGMLGRGASHPAVMGILAAASILPLLGMGAKSASEDTDKLATSIGGLEAEATSASQQLARLIIDLRRVSVAYGTSTNQLLSASALYSSVGSANPMADSQGFARFIEQIRGGLVTGQPNNQQMLASSMLGINPMDALNMSTNQLRNYAVDQLRAMPEDRRGGARTRSYLRQAFGEEEATNMMMMAEMSGERLADARRKQRVMEMMSSGRMDERMGERASQILDIGTRRQYGQFMVARQREYLRTGGGAAPVWEETKLQVQEQIWRAQLAFWHSMLPVLEQFRDVLSGVGKQGGIISTFGDIMEAGAEEIAQALKTIIASFFFATGAIQTAMMPLHLMGHGAEGLGALARGDLTGAMSQGRNMIDTLAAPGRTYQRGWNILADNPYDTSAAMDYSPAFQHGQYRSMVDVRMTGDASDFFTAGVQSGNRQGKAIRLQPQRPAASLDLQP